MTILFKDKNDSDILTVVEVEYAAYNDNYYNQTGLY